MSSTVSRELYTPGSEDLEGRALLLRDATVKREDFQNNDTLKRLTLHQLVKGHQEGWFHPEECDVALEAAEQRGELKEYMSVFRVPLRRHPELAEVSLDSLKHW